MNDVLSPEQIAEILDCTPETAEEHLRSGNLPGVKFGRSWRSPREALFARLNELAVQEAAERREPKPVSPVLKRRKRALPAEYLEVAARMAAGAVPNIDVKTDPKTGVTTKAFRPSQIRVTSSNA